MILQHALDWWGRLPPNGRVAVAALGGATAFAAAAAIILLDLEGRLFFLAFPVLWIVAALNKGARAEHDGQAAERARRRNLVAKYGHVPLADLADSPTTLTEMQTAPNPAYVSAEALERERRAALTAQYGHVPLTELADPVHTGGSNLYADKPAPRPYRPEPAPAARPAPARNAPAKPVAAPVTPSVSSPIVEAAPSPWRRQRRRAIPGSIVE